MIKILHLYYDSMNLYGDYGNVEALKKHLEDQGERVVIDRKTTVLNLHFNDYDFIYIGSGTESALKHVKVDLMTNSEGFVSAIDSNKIILLTGNAMELVSKENLGILDISVKETDKRYTGDVIVKNKELGEVVGYINKCSIITSGSINPLFEVEYLDNNLDKIKNEGYQYRNLYGTHLIGPLLVKNPNLMEYFVKNLIDTEYKNIDYHYENESYKIALNELKKRSKK